MNKLLKEIEGKSVYILSPHLDDAALSCGSSLAELVGNLDVTVVNIFTKAHRGPYTLSAKKFLRASGGYKDAVKLFSVRQKEDKIALQSIKVTRIVSIGLTDALFRRKGISFIGKLIPEVDHVYPIHRLHITKKVREEDPASEELGEKLKTLVKKSSVVFAPYGIGKHVDHTIARRACVKLFDNVILYSDFPYNFWNSNYGETPKGYKKIELKADIDKKTKLLRCYGTQFRSLFPNGRVPAHKEVFFVKK